jgi:hypothetical protein
MDGQAKRGDVETGDFDSGGPAAQAQVHVKDEDVGPLDRCDEVSAALTGKRHGFDSSGESGGSNLTATR